MYIIYINEILMIQVNIYYAIKRWAKMATTIVANRGMK